MARLLQTVISGSTVITGSVIISASAGVGLRVYGGASGSFSGSFFGNGANLTGLSISGLTSGVLPIANGGTGLSNLPAQGQIIIGNDGGDYILGSISGTTNQVVVTNDAGAITLSTPQSIATTSNVTFGTVVLGTATTLTTQAVRADRTFTFTQEVGGNVTITNSGTALDLTANRSLQLGWSGTLSQIRGGFAKDVSTLTNDRLFYKDVNGIINSLTSDGLIYNNKTTSKVATYSSVVQNTLVRIVDDSPAASIIKDDGTNVGINATPSTYRLTVGGDLGVTGTVYETSTIKIKKNIESLTDELSKIIQTRPVEFDYIETGVHSYGFIAQELNEIYPDTVIKDDNGETIGVAYADLTSPIMRAIQQLSEKIDNLTKRVEELENK